MPSFVTHLECTRCGKQYDHRQLQTLCHDCARPLYARYDLAALGAAVSKEDLRGRESSLWRYAEFLPIGETTERVSFGEGWTPLLACPRLGAELGLTDLLVKDEGQIATGSFKARGMAVAVTKAKELGATSLAVPSAGNAGGAMAQYGARAGLECHVFMPVDVPQLNRIECVAAGAKTFLVRGLITDCGKIVREGTPSKGWFDMSTLKEPYRVEGKKTMGLEIAEQLGWELPDVILYPTGGGTGLVGMWKAFQELEAIGWIGSKRPRMVAVQSEGCAPIARAFHNGDEFAEPWKDAATMASGIRVPAAVGDFLMLQALRESGGTAVTVSDAEIDAATRLTTRLEGLFVCPEGGAVVAGLQKLIADGWVQPDEKVVVFNTGTGLKYPECFPVDLPVLDPRETIDYSSL
ncbi:MAG: threonine synthase [Armatimonadetes bacterium]|jgi:threonine synthase|nr:threonine synthase [Armatimonadota bacterium]